MTLYRYLDFDGGLETLKNGTLKLTPPSEFNDPFEMYPTFAVDIGHVFSESRAAGKIPRELSFEDFKGKTDLRAINRAAQEEHRRGMNETLGAVCFSRKPNSPAMWAYYGQHHTGIVIGFDADHRDFPPQYRNMLCKVRYEKQRPRVTDLNSPDDLYHFYTKSREWRHEGEIRILMPFETLCVQHGKIKGRKACFIPFPKAVVHSIYLGCRMPEDQQREVIARLPAWGYTGIRKVFRFEPDMDTYRLNERELHLG